MPDDDWALGQNEVDVRNEARKPQHEPPWLDDRDDMRIDDPANDDLAAAIDHLRRLHETQAINADAEQRRQQSITRTLDEIQRLMDV